MLDEPENQPLGKEDSVKEDYLVDKAQKRKRLLTEVRLWGDEDTRRAGSVNQLPLRRGFTVERAEATHRGSRRRKLEFRIDCSAVIMNQPDEEAG